MKFPINCDCGEYFRRLVEQREERSRASSATLYQPSHSGSGGLRIRYVHFMIVRSEAGL